MKPGITTMALMAMHTLALAQNVGIGTATPSGKLEVLQTGSTPGLRIQINNPASLTPGVFVVSNAQGGPIEAISTITTGTVNGVTGVVSSSANGNATAGVTGVLGVSQAQNAGFFATGVKGINSSGNAFGMGVIGYHAGFGIGVYGEGGTGIYGFGRGANAEGVIGYVTDASATGIVAEYGGTGAGTAMVVKNGRLGASGTNKFAFKHQAAAGNTGGNSTIINNA